MKQAKLVVVPLRAAPGVTTPATVRREADPPLRLSYRPTPMKPIAAPPWAAPGLTTRAAASWVLHQVPRKTAPDVSRVDTPGVWPRILIRQAGVKLADAAAPAPEPAPEGTPLRAVHTIPHRSRTPPPVRQRFPDTSAVRQPMRIKPYMIECILTALGVAPLPSLHRQRRLPPRLPLPLPNLSAATTPSLLSLPMQAALRQ